MGLKNEGVRAVITGVKPETVWAMFQAELIWPRGSVPSVPFIITSITDGQHVPKSKHYQGQAFDIRAKYPNVVHFVRQLRDRLGPDYRIIYGPPDHLDHIHVEFNPKTN
jgi:hypothetical protein